MQNPLQLLDIRKRLATGFTLIELLVALFIFVILSLIVTMGLRTILNDQQRLTQADDVVQNAEIAMTLIQRDVTQMIDRPITDSNDSPLPSLSFSGNGLEFTRAGYTNPNGAQKRSELQRVAYVVNNGALERLTWQALDRPPNAKPSVRVLLKGITGLQVQFITIVSGQGQLSGSWSPMMGSYFDPNQRMPAGIVVTFQFARGGQVQRVFPIPGVGLGTPYVQ